MTWNAPIPDPIGRPASAPAARSPYLGAVRDAWRRARHEGAPRGDALALALCLYARDGRARGVPVASLLRALDGLGSSHTDGGEADGDDRVREWASAEVIRAYYGVD